MQELPLLLGAKAPAVRTSSRSSSTRGEMVVALATSTALGLMEALIMYRAVAGYAAVAGCF